MNKIRVMLTGLSGQVGQSILRNCSNNYHIIALSRNELDLSDQQQIIRVISELKPDIIINPAAYTNVEMAEDNKDEAYLVNVMAPKIMAKEANKLCIPLVHFSTDYVFDGTKNEPYNESDKPNPINVYGNTKLEGEIAIQKNTKLFYIFRTSWLFSSLGKNFFTTMLKLLQKKRELNVINNQFGSPTSSDLIAQKLFLFLDVALLKEKSKDLYGIYNLTSSGMTSWYDYARKINKLLGKENSADIYSVNSKSYVTKAKRPEMSVLDNTKLNDIIGEMDDFWEVVLQKEHKKIILNDN